MLLTLLEHAQRALPIGTGNKPERLLAMAWIASSGCGVLMVIFLLLVSVSCRAGPFRSVSMSPRRGDHVIPHAHHEFGICTAVMFWILASG